MTTESTSALADLLRLDPEVDAFSVTSATDMKLSIGSDVVRLRWRRQVTMAVAADADLKTSCGALLDALYVWRFASAGEDLDRSTVNVLVDRSMPPASGTECDEALRSMRDAVVGVTASIWYRGEHGRWNRDDRAAPTWDGNEWIATEWVQRLQVPRFEAPPTDLATDFIDAVGDPSLHLYPSEVREGRTDRWAIRADGLEIGIAGSESVVLGVGGEKSDGAQTGHFMAAFTERSVRVTRSGGDGSKSFEEAAALTRSMLRSMRLHDVHGAPLTHRGDHVDEHALESRLLKGIVRIDGLDLVGDPEVARGSQFPTKWGTSPKAPARYLDALLRRGSVPVAIELKVATGGQGRYYRRSLIQAVLYAHYIRHTDVLDGWFEAAGLDRCSVTPAIGVPMPNVWTFDWEASLSDLREIGAMVGVQVFELDPWALPDRVDPPSGPEPSIDRIRELSARLASTIADLFPRDLSAVSAQLDAGGFYDTIRIDWSRQRPGRPGPRIVLNRPGSAFVFNARVGWRWSWSGVWGYVDATGDFDGAARTLGAVAGFRPPTTG